MNTLFRTLVVCTFASTIVACGGGSSGSSNEPSNPVTPADPDPTVTVTQENERCEVAKECLVLSGEVSKNATATTFNLDGVDSAVVEVAGERTEVNSDGSVSFSASKSFKLFVTHSAVETLTLGLTNFTVEGKQYSSSDSVDVEFYAPAANATIDIPNLECGEGSCTGTLYADTPIDSATFSLDDGVTVNVETGEESYTADSSGVVSFPATSQADVTFSIDREFVIQQVSRVTSNTLDSVTVSGISQDVNESYELSFDRDTNVEVVMSIATIYGGANITTDPQHEKLAVKKVVQFGPDIEVDHERVLVETLAYTFEKWDAENNQFQVVGEGIIEDASGLSLDESDKIMLQADTTPWKYRMHVTATINGGDKLVASETFIKRDELHNLYLRLFPMGVTAQRVDEIHAEYDALEEGAEFSSTLANLYPREYMDENGNINAVDCTYSLAFFGDFPSVDTAAEVDKLSYCNTATQFSSALVFTEQSMVVNVSSQEHDDLVEVDYTMPRSSMDFNYQARQGSNVVKLKFHSFANQGQVKFGLTFVTPDTSGVKNSVEFDVAGN